MLNLKPDLPQPRKSFLMNFIRSTFLNVYFFGFTIMACLLLLWTFLLPRNIAYRAILWYFRGLHWGEKTIMGLDYRVEGYENLPQAGSYIIAMKHYSVYETMKLFMIFGHVAIILKKQLMRIPLWGWYAWKIQMIPVDRAARERAMQNIINGAKPVVSDGRPIIIFPQGTRINVGDSIIDKPYKYGVIRLYNILNIPIVPVAVDSGLFWPCKSYMKKPGIVTFRILPIIPAGLPTDEAFDRMRDAIETETDKLITKHHEDKNSSI